MWNKARSIIWSRGTKMGENSVGHFPQKRAFKGCIQSCLSQHHSQQLSSGPNDFFPGILQQPPYCTSGFPCLLPLIYASYWNIRSHEVKHLLKTGTFYLQSAVYISISMEFKTLYDLSPTYFYPLFWLRVVTLTCHAHPHLIHLLKPPFLNGVDLIRPSSGHWSLDSLKQ